MPRAAADCLIGVLAQVLLQQGLQLVGLHGLQHTGRKGTHHAGAQAAGARDAIGPARRGEISALQPQHHQAESAVLDPGGKLRRDRAGHAVRAAPPLGKKAQALTAGGRFVQSVLPGQLLRLAQAAGEAEQQPGTRRGIGAGKAERTVDAYGGEQRVIVARMVAQQHEGPVHSGLPGLKMQFETQDQTEQRAQNRPEHSVR